MEFNPRYRGRIRAAYWSKTLLAIAAVLSVLILPFSFDVENAVVVAGVLVVTFFEFRVHHYFLTGDPRAPGLGFRNQSGLAAGILLYALWLYHVNEPVPIPEEYRDLLDPDQVALIEGMVKYSFVVAGALGGLSQFGLACYYRFAQSPAAGKPDGPAGRSRGA